ncbi:structural maintenance of chromosomes protein 6, partial [Caerostris darwini]
MKTLCLKTMKRQQINENSSRPQKRQKSEGKLGIIESITLQNFMCHENLHLKLGAHVNFIIGQNGSGKSAILTAIILALGGNSRSTDRYSSIKGFVKNGKNKGKIELVLRNSGPSAYKPKVYGEKIIIIREFNKEGVTTYKIKSESGTICSNQKSELMNIKDALDIMIESPVCVLTQANSKKFLISKDAKEDRLFEFFCKGSGIERLEIAYKYLERLNSESKEEIEKKKQNIPELKKEIKKLKKIIDNSDKISDYQNELTWAAVIQMEKYVEGKKAEYKQLENERENNIEQLKKCEDHYEVNSVKLEEYGKKKEESEISMNQCREDLEKLKFTNETCSSSVRNCRGKLEQLLRDKKQLKEDMLGLKTSIQEQNAKNDKNIEEENKQRMEAMERLKENNSELAKDVENCEKIRSEKMEIQAKIEKNIRELNVEVKNNYRLKELEDSLLASKKALINKLNAFGEHTEKVLGDLNNESIFKKQPVGPI